MPVHAAELQLLSVEEQAAVPDLHPPQAHGQADRFIARGDPQRIQIRRFAAPQNRIGYAETQRSPGLFFHKAAVRRVKAARYGKIRRDIRRYGKLGICEIFRHTGNAVDIPYMRGVAGEDIHVPENARKPEEILIFHIAAGAVLHHQRLHGVFAVLQLFGDLEFTVGVAHLRIADPHAVEPEVEAGGNAVEIEKIPPVLRFGQREGPAVKAAGNDIRQMRRIHREGVILIDIIRRVPSPAGLELPAAGHGEPIRTFHAAGKAGPFKLERFHVREPPEIPRAVQAQKA